MRQPLEAIISIADKEQRVINRSGDRFWGLHRKSLLQLSRWLNLNRFGRQRQMDARQAVKTDQNALAVAASDDTDKPC
jgi:hypothetical protein